MVVVGWFVITTMAFFSRYERMTPVLAMLMAGLIVLVAGIGLSWAAYPGVRAKERHNKA